MGQMSLSTDQRGHESFGGPHPHLYTVRLSWLLLFQQHQVLDNPDSRPDRRSGCAAGSRPEPIEFKTVQSACKERW